MSILKEFFMSTFRENKFKNYFQFVPYLLFTIPSFFLFKTFFYQFNHYHYLSHSLTEILICFFASLYGLMIIFFPILLLLDKVCNNITYYHNPKKINYFINQYNKKLIKKYANFNQHPDILNMINYISFLFVSDLRRDIQLVNLDKSFNCDFNNISKDNKECLEYVLKHTYGLDVCFAFSILTNNESFYKFLISLTKRPIINMDLFKFDKENHHFTLDSFLFDNAHFAELYIPNNHLVIGSPYIYNHLNSEKAPESILSLLRKTTWPRKSDSYSSSSSTHHYDMTQFNELIYHKTLEAQARMKKEYEEKKTFSYYAQQKHNLYDICDKFTEYIKSIKSLEEQLEYTHYLEKMIFILNEMNESNYSFVNKDYIFIDFILTNIPSIISHKIDNKDKSYFLSYIDNVFAFLVNQINQDFKCVSNSINNNFGHYKFTFFK